MGEPNMTYCGGKELAASFRGPRQHHSDRGEIPEPHDFRAAADCRSIDRRSRTLRRIGHSDAHTLNKIDDLKKSISGADGS
jgi:hypothetical protein